MLKNSFITLIVLFILVLNACTSIEKKRGATIALLNEAKDTTSLTFYAEEFKENSLSFIDDEILEYLANNKRFANLDGLTIYGLNQVSDQGMKHLLKFKKLRRLHLFGSETITNEGLQLLSDLEALIDLHIRAFDAIKHLQLHNFAHLEKINVDNCQNIDNVSFNDFPNCWNIQFWECPKLTATSKVKIDNCNKPQVFYCLCWNLNQVNIETNDSIWKITVWRSSLEADGFSTIKNIKGIETIDLDLLKADSLIIPPLPDLEKLIYGDDGKRGDTMLLSKLIVRDSPKLSSIYIRTNCLQELAVDSIPSLKSLEFSHFRGFKLDKLNLLKFKNLERLSIRGEGTGKLLDDISQLSKLNDLELSIGKISGQYQGNKLKNWLKMKSWNH